MEFRGATMRIHHRIDLTRCSSFVLIALALTATGVSRANTPRISFRQHHQLCRARLVYHELFSADPAGTAPVPVAIAGMGSGSHSVGVIGDAIGTDGIGVSARVTGAKRDGGSWR